MTLSFSWLKNPIWFVRLFVTSTAVALLISFFSYRQLRGQLGFALPELLFEQAQQNSTVNDDGAFVPVNRNPAYLHSVCRLDRVAAVGLSAMVHQKNKPTVKRQKTRTRRVPHNRHVPSVFLEGKAAASHLPAYDGTFSLPIQRTHFWLSSPFGPRRRANGHRGFHNGIDMAAFRGTPVMAAGGGVVVFAGNGGPYGNLVIIEHDERCRTWYAHMSAIKTQVGAQVVQGKVIGLVGATGYVRKRRGGSGDHLHFGMYIDGRPVNPVHFLR